MELEGDGSSFIEDDLTEFGGDGSDGTGKGDVEPVSSVIFGNGIDGAWGRDGSDQDIVDKDFGSLSLSISTSGARSSG